LVALSDPSTDAYSVRFVTGRELAAVQDDDVLEQADLWKQEVSGRCR
jgi:hypothetical protein